MVLIKHVENILEVTHIFGDHEGKMAKRVLFVEFENFGKLSFGPLVVKDGSELI